MAKEEEVKHAIAKKEAAIARQRDEEVRRTDYFDFLRGGGSREDRENAARGLQSLFNDSAAKRADLD